jgi:hypothetical protein
VFDRSGDPVGDRFAELLALLDANSQPSNLTMSADGTLHLRLGRTPFALPPAMAAAAADLVVQRRWFHDRTEPTSLPGWLFVGRHGRPILSTTLRYRARPLTM